MARIDWVRARLENWARWHASGRNCGLGYPSESAFVRLRISGGERGGCIPVRDSDAVEIEEVVRMLRLRRSHLYLVLTLHYAQGVPVHDVARRMSRAVSTIKRNLEDADRAVFLLLEAKKSKP